MEKMRPILNRLNSYFFPRDEKKLIPKKKTSKLGTGRAPSTKESSQRSNRLSSSSSSNKNSGASKTKSEKPEMHTSRPTLARTKSYMEARCSAASQECMSKWLARLPTLSTIASKRKAELPVEDLNDLSYAHPLLETMEAGAINGGYCGSESSGELISSSLSSSSLESSCDTEMQSWTALHAEISDLICSDRSMSLSPVPFALSPLNATSSGDLQEEERLG